MDYIEVIEQSISRMGDYELSERLISGKFSDDAKIIAEKELSKRGIKPNDVILAEESISNYEYENRPFKPIFLPLLFSTISGVFTGAKFGAEILGAIGAGLGAGLVGLIGWKIGYIVACFAHKQNRRYIRIIIYCISITVFLLINLLALIAYSFH